MKINKPVLTAFLIIIVSQLVLFFIKVTNVVKIGWEWVFAPLWIPYSILLLCGVVVVVYITFLNIKQRNSRNEGG